MKSSMPELNDISPREIAAKGPTLVGIGQEQGKRPSSSWNKDQAAPRFHDRQYPLQLADGSGWCLCGVPRMGKWVDKFGSIMGLKPACTSDFPRMVFCGMKDFPSLIKISKADFNGLSPEKEQGWSTKEYPFFQLGYHTGFPDILCEIYVDEIDETSEIGILSMQDALQFIYQKAQENGGIPLHAALLELRGLGILIAGPGNTGKSTCCSRVPSPWISLGDDEALVLWDQKRRLRAHPFPTWSKYLLRDSKEVWNVEHSPLVAGIFFLEQSATDEVIPIGEGLAAVMLNQSATQIWQKYWRGLGEEEKRRTAGQLFHNACVMAKQVRAFVLRASLNGRFWEKIEKVL